MLKVVAWGDSLENSELWQALLLVTSLLCVNPSPSGLSPSELSPKDGATEPIYVGMVPVAFKSRFAM
jgi:hypothetical protein